jgi:APA family basic amino acid/polyamine antiporter
MKLVRPVAGLGLAFALWVMWGSGLEAALLSVALMLTAVPLYLLARRRRSGEQPA